MSDLLEKYCPARKVGQSLYDYLVELSDWAKDNDERYELARRFGKREIGQASTEDLRAYENRRAMDKLIK